MNTRELLVILLGLALTLIGCAAGPRPRPAKSLRQFEFRNVRVTGDGPPQCEVATTATDAKSGKVIVFCK